MTIGVAVIGAGMAGRAHAAAYRAATSLYDSNLPDVRLVSIGDVNSAFGKAAADRLAATGGLSTADRITINVSGAIDPEGTARTIVNTLNDSYYRGTNGAGSLQFA
jgi:ornithine cyclodeaminase/alanine dehydrogenase-like protein (mu-crystallin family)